MHRLSLAFVWNISGIMNTVHNDDGAQHFPNDDLRSGENLRLGGDLFV